MRSIAVIIPTFNRVHTLGRALESVVNQKRLPDEIIVVDDGSSDTTKDFIQKHYPSVRYLYQENRGPAAARNLGISRANSEWLAFLDSDDEWTPDKLLVQEDFFSGHAEYLIAQTEEIWIRNGKRVNPMKKHKKPGGWVFEKCLSLCVISPSAVMIHRSLFDAEGLFDESYPACEDYELWLRIASRHPVGLIDKNCVIKYGGHADQRSHEFPAMDRFRIRALASLIKNGRLSEAQNAAAFETLREKSSIYISGAEKRGKTREAAECRELVHEAALAAAEIKHSGALLE